MAIHEKILILGGTREAAKLAACLVSRGHQVTTSLAGRTREPEPVAGAIRIGGFSSANVNGARGLANFLLENRFTRLIDATHPFARQISKNAVEAALLANVTFEQRQRKPWQAMPVDNWTEVASLETARDEIPDGARVFLALGSQFLSAFETRKDAFFLVRMVDAPAEPLAIANHKLVLGRPAADPQAEEKLLRDHQISHIVCRNSGGDGAYAKIIAARNLKIPVIMISR